jgi:hypothetical protein
LTKKRSARSSQKKGIKVWARLRSGLYGGLYAPRMLDTERDDAECLARPLDGMLQDSFDHPFDLSGRTFLLPYRRRHKHV